MVLDYVAIARYPFRTSVQNNTVAKQNRILKSKHNLMFFNKTNNYIAITFCQTDHYHCMNHLRPWSLFSKISLNTWEIQLFLINTSKRENFEPNCSFTLINKIA